MTQAAMAGGGSALIVIFGFGIIEGRASLGAVIGVAVIAVVSIVLARREGRRLLTDISLWLSSSVLAICSLALL